MKNDKRSTLVNSKLNNDLVLMGCTGDIMLQTNFSEVFLKLDKKIFFQLNSFVSNNLCACTMYVLNKLYFCNRIYFIPELSTSTDNHNK